nr:hypothetical protein GCM10020093_016020 [Planobispora longispora]
MSNGAAGGDAVGDMAGKRERRVRVVVADDQTVVREGLVLLLGLLPGVEVAGVAADGAEAVGLAEEIRPDLVLMDLRMPRMDGVEATARIRSSCPEVQVLVLTTYSDDESVFAAIRAGARGYLTKDTDAEGSPSRCRPWRRAGPSSTPRCSAGSRRPRRGRGGSRGCRTG